MRTMIHHIPDSQIDPRYVEATRLWNAGRHDEAAPLLLDLWHNLPAKGAIRPGGIMNVIAMLSHCETLGLIPRGTVANRFATAGAR